MSQSEILVVGSLAFDVIFSIPHDFRQSVPLEDGQIRNFNATYVANGKNEFPGGTAGNIAMWLGMQQVPCSVFSAWGTDLESKGYKAKLESVGAQLRGGVGAFTAHCYSVSDPLHQQLVIWQPNHYEFNQKQRLTDFYHNTELSHFKQAIFSAGTPNSIAAHMQEFKNHNNAAKVIFDPGQVTPFFTVQEFKRCVDLSDIIIGNDIEETHFNDFMKEDWPSHLQRIITLGENGARYYFEDEWVYVDPVTVKEVVETTGAGDAFRAGLIAGLTKGNHLAEALKNGAKLGSQCVKIPAGQPI